MWFYLGGVHGFISGACMVLFGGHVWLYLGGMCGFIQEVHGFIPGGTCGFSGGMHGFSRGCVVFPGGHAWFFQFFRIQ